MDIKLLIASGVTAVALLAASAARADLLFEYSIPPGDFMTWCSVPTGTTGSCSQSGGIPSTSWVLQGTAVSQSPGPPNPNLLETIVNLTNNAGTPQTIELSIGDLNFTTPTPSGLNLISSISGVPGSDPPTPGTLSFISCLDPLDRQNYCAGVSAITTPTLAISFNEGGVPFSGSESVTILSLSPPYSLTQTLTITLQPFSSVNFTATTNVAAVPEPASIAVLGVGLFGMGFLRRRGGRASGIESDKAG